MLLDQTVTVYRRDGTRKVVDNCQFILKKGQTVDIHGQRQRDKFSLIARGGVDLRPGDRVLQGIGPEQVQWMEFIPEKVDGLVTVGYVQPFYWAGRVSHIEAGGFYEGY